MKLIDKDKIAAELEKRYEYWREKEFNSHSIESEIRMSECQHLMLLLNTIKTKEVNLEKEVEDWVKIGPHTSYPWCTIPDAIRITAEHFYELGLKAKGE